MTYTFSHPSYRKQGSGYSSHFICTYSFLLKQVEKDAAYGLSWTVWCVAPFDWLCCSLLFIRILDRKRMNGDRMNNFRMRASTYLLEFAIVTDKQALQAGSDNRTLPSRLPARLPVITMMQSENQEPWSQERGQNSAPSLEDCDNLVCESVILPTFGKIFTLR